MTTVNADTYTGKVNLPQPFSADVAPIVIPFTFPTAAPVAGDVHNLLSLPANIEVVDWKLQMPDVDSGAAVVISLGTGPSGQTTLASAWGSSLSTGQAGGVVRDTTGVAMTETATAKRDIRLVHNVAAATWVPGLSGKLIVTLRGPTA